ncbi:protein Shroom4-like isoform 2-T2 [Anomaloglossus baeobatrachus]
MESLDQPEHNFFDGTISPLDTGIYHNKRDSAYSSFSTSSKISDSTSSRIDESSSPINCFLGSNKREEDQYLQTGQGAVDSQVNSSRQSPLQPPIRRDSLRENKTEFCNSDKRTSCPCYLFHMSGMWSSQPSHFNSSENAMCQCTNAPRTGHLFENLSSDHYYMLSSQTDKVQQFNTNAMDDMKKSNQCTESKIKLSKDDREMKVINCSNFEKVQDHKVVKNSYCEHRKALNHQCNQTDMSIEQVSFRKDMESISPEDYHFPIEKSKENIEKRYKCNVKNFEISKHPSTEQPSDIGDAYVCSSLDKSITMPNDPPSSQSNNSVDRLTSTCITNTLTQDAAEEEETLGLIKKPGSSRHRSTQMRRKSDRFATNLRNEIQRRKAQLQKTKDCKVLLSCDEFVEDKSEAFVSPPEIIPPLPPPKSKALFLENKRANAEKCISSKDFLAQEKMEGELSDNNIETHKPTIKENILSTCEAVTEDEGFLMTAKNNECWKSKSSDKYYQKSVFQKTNQVYHPKNNDQICSNTTTDFQHAMYMPPKPDMCKIEEEVSIYSQKITVERKQSANICGTDRLNNSSDNQLQTETLDKHTHEDTCYMNNHSMDSDMERDLIQFTSEQPITGRKISYQVNLGQEKNNYETRNANDLSAAAQPSSLQQFSATKHFSSCNPKNGAKCSCSPDHNLRNIFFTEREVSQELRPTTKVCDENILMSFSDRKKFFEDVCKEPTFIVNNKPNVDDKANFYPSIPDNHVSYSMVPDVRSNSVDYTHCTTSLRQQDSKLPHCDLCWNHAIDPTMCCNEEEQTTNYLPSLSYALRTCIFCCNYFCPALLKRNILAAHPSCHCSHLQPHQHHRWAKCADYSFPTPYHSSEESAFLYVDQINMRKPLLQDTSLKECNQRHLKINKKSSQSVSDLTSFPPGIQHSGSTKQCCERNSHEWSELSKTTSSYDLSYDNFIRPKELASFQSGHLEPSRNRAYSVSQLDLEYLALRDKMEFPSTILEERKPSTQSKKQKPPRPPPPKWEKYKENQASKQLAKSELFYCKEKSESEFSRLPRQHSQSLPVDRTSAKVACNLSPPIDGLNPIKELSEINCASQRSQEESSLADSANQNALAYEEFQPISPTTLRGTVSPTTGATYYNISAAKADLLNRMKDKTGEEEETGNVTEEDNEESELTSKKLQLIESISRKVAVLHEAQQGLQEDINANATLGHELKNLLKNICKPNEYDKFRIFIGDLDKVISLLLSLSGRLSRVESALNCEDPLPSMEVKMTLLDKKKQLTDQLEDAKELKVHVTRREQVVLETVSKYLNDEELQDYHHYVKMTSALIVEQRELEDKIRLGEEQLRCLRESL